ncbi:TspO protein [Mycobacterium sp. IS-1742]|uniref:TspO/MBR family protein n=1 Tax=Mycobacterium sp. IS-1742 TaxID=1772285 RepID=UPI00073FE41D|nr:TspO/MBR family protein [Mycobacterium sp. IS-1742]KUI32451.1 TspO protein [Mycobacterium sp. IS-1742]
MRASTLARTAGTVFATGALGGLANRDMPSLWYAKLKKPSFQPPGQTFGIVWPMLYADIAAVSASTIDHYRDTGQPEKARAYTTALAANLILNGSWSWLFFNQHKLALSAVTAGALAASSADLTRRAVEAKGAQAAPLALYPLWCGFATVLSSRIWWLNR